MEYITALRRGTRLKEYEIHEVLGQGGFGITYPAEDTHLHKQIALKEYPPGEFAMRTMGAPWCPTWNPQPWHLILALMRIMSSRMLRVCFVSVLIGLSFVLGVSADPPPAPDADPPAQAEQNPQAPEDACADVNEQGEQVDCWCVQAVIREASPEIDMIVEELNQHPGTWRMDMLLECVTIPCLKRCAEAFDETITRTEKEISQYEASDLLAELGETIPSGACPEAEEYNEPFMRYECWRRTGAITDAQYSLLSSYGGQAPLDHAARNAAYLANVRSRAAKRSCMLACCGSAPPSLRYPASR